VSRPIFAYRQRRELTIASDNGLPRGRGRIGRRGAVAESGLLCLGAVQKACSGAPGPERRVCRGVPLFHTRRCRNWFSCLTKPSQICGQTFQEAAWRWAAQGLAAQSYIRGKNEAGLMPKRSEIERIWRVLISRFPFNDSDMTP
jgi:hypothetical protein